MARPRGRPRSPDIDARLLGATRQALARGGYAAVSMEEVAAAAGVGKQSLYRRWPRKPLLVFAAAFRSVEEVLANLPDTGTLAGDVAEYARNMDALFSSPQVQDVTRGILADAMADPATLEELRERFIRPQVRAIRIMVDQALARGEVAPDLDTEAIADLLFGAPLTHFLLIGRGDPFGDALVRIVSRGVTSTPSA